MEDHGFLRYPSTPEEMAAYTIAKVLGHIIVEHVAAGGSIEDLRYLLEH